MLARHGGEIKDMHGNHRSEMSKTQGRHAKEIADMAARHMSEAAAPMPAPEAAGAAEGDVAAAEV